MTTKYNNEIINTEYKKAYILVRYAFMLGFGFDKIVIDVEDNDAPNTIAEKGVGYIIILPFVIIIITKSFK